MLELLSPHLRFTERHPLDNFFKANISSFFKKTSTDLDDILIEKGVLNRLSYFIPLIFIYNLKDLLVVYDIVDRILISLIALILVSTVNAFINALSPSEPLQLRSIPLSKRNFITS